MTPDTAIVVAGGIALFVLGTIFGSFANVVIARVPEGRSVVRPRSACPACGAQIGARDNIPILSWLLLRARCRSCQEPISVRYPLVEFVTGLLFVGSGAWVWVVGSPGLLPLLLVWSFVGVCLAVIDLDHHRLPNAITMPMLVVTPIGLLLAWFIDMLIDGTPASGGVWGALVGAAIWVGVLGLLWGVTGGRGMGLGDVKLAPSLGATLGWLGWEVAAVGLFLSFVLGAVIGIILLLTRKVERRSAVPFGPFLLLGSATSLALGAVVADAYADVVFG